MNTEEKTTAEKTYGCETCAMRMKAEEKPGSFMAKLWRWHTRWCPGWKEYQLHLAEQAEAAGGHHG